MQHWSPQQVSAAEQLPPLQGGVPQCPMPQHGWSPPQVTPQPPQLWMSSSSSTHAPLQQVSPSLHGGEQVLPPVLELTLLELLVVVVPELLVVVVPELLVVVVVPLELVVVVVVPELLVVVVAVPVVVVPVVVVVVPPPLPEAVLVAPAVPVVELFPEAPVTEPPLPVVPLPLPVAPPPPHDHAAQAEKQRITPGTKRGDLMERDQGAVRPGMQAPC
jgi:hypothetical protein